MWWDVGAALGGAWGGWYASKSNGLSMGLTTEGGVGNGGGLGRMGTGGMVVSWGGAGGEKKRRVAGCRSDGNHNNKWETGLTLAMGCNVAGNGAVVVTVNNDDRHRSTAVVIVE